MMKWMIFLENINHQKYSKKSKKSKRLITTGKTTKRESGQKTINTTHAQKGEKEKIKTQLTSDSTQRTIKEQIIVVFVKLFQST